jgi:hypothetical protein
MMRSAGPGLQPVSRRTVLIGGLAVVIGAGTGVGVGAIRPLHRHHSGNPPPTDLLAALVAEQALIARLDAVTTADRTLQGLLAGIRADHQQHGASLAAALRAYEPAPAAPSVTAPAASAASRAELRSAEQIAAARAARRAARLSGSPATLLASIAASEASHAEALR